MDSQRWIQEDAAGRIGGEAAWTGSALAWVTTGFVALGLAMRAVRYLLNFPLYCDESMIAANFLDRGYLDLLRPLDFHQVGPLLWLAVELSLVKALGFSEWSLRLFPFLSGMASVVLFRHVAGRLLGGVPLLLAVALFTVSGPPLVYAAAVKPYASDLFVALVVLALAVEWRRRPDRIGWLWALAAFGPVAVALSLPSLFVLGGVGLGLALPCWRSERRGARVALLLFGAGVSFTFVALLPYYKTAPGDHRQFHTAWAGAFPPLDRPAGLAWWLLDVHTGAMFGYPEGAERGGSALTFIAFATGAVVFWRRKGASASALLLAPFPFALAAAAVRRYPYGVSSRTAQYAAPAICLLAALGFATAVGAVRSADGRRRSLAALAAVLALLGVGRLGFDVVHPYKTYTDQRDRDFARWFWTELSRNAELVCPKTDLGVVFDPTHWKKDAVDTYLCYQRIYSPRHRKARPADLAAVAEAHPLRVALFNEFPQGRSEYQDWIGAMLSRYRLHSVTPYPVSSLESKPGANWDELYVVYEFRPLLGIAAGPAPSVSPASR